MTKECGLSVSSFNDFMKGKVKEEMMIPCKRPIKYRIEYPNTSPMELCVHHTREFFSNHMTQKEIKKYIKRIR